MDKAVVQLLCDMKDDDCHIRFAAVRTLGDMGCCDSVAQDALLDALKDAIWFVRLAALQTLREIRPEPAVVIDRGCNGIQTYLEFLSIHCVVLFPHLY